MYVGVGKSIIRFVENWLLAKLASLSDNEAASLTKM